MGKLTYKKVFSRYNVSLSDRLARKSFYYYKKIRSATSKLFPLSKKERIHFEDYNFEGRTSVEMPEGYNLLDNKIEDGYINLEYVDLFDYLPKENLSVFKKQLDKFVLKNRLFRYGGIYTKKEINRIDNIGKYYDNWHYTNLFTVELVHNSYIRKFSPMVSISLINLSSSYLVVMYRFCLSEEFNNQLNAIYKRKYDSFSEINRQINVPWFRFLKHGRAFYRGNDARARELYNYISLFKWKAFLELKHYFKIHFENNLLFPPIFETYSTNIRPSNSVEKLRFWDGIISGVSEDYSLKYNACVCWNYSHGEHEGMCLSAYFGGNYSNSSSLPEIALYSISQEYAVFLTADSFINIAKHDIAICNKKISSAINKSNASAILKLRVEVERKLYYSYRFVSEFSGNTINIDEIECFRSKFSKKSKTKSRFEWVSTLTHDTKNQIDELLKILNDAADYNNAKSSMILQMIMLLIAAISLFVAIVALLNSDLSAIIDIWNKIANSNTC